MSFRCSHTKPEKLTEDQFWNLTHFSGYPNWGYHTMYARTYKYTNSLTPLVKKGYLDANLQEDWRSRRFQITDKGREALQPWMEAMKAEDRARNETNRREQALRDHESKLFVHFPEPVKAGTATYDLLYNLLQQHADFCEAEGDEPNPTLRGLLQAFEASMKEFEAGVPV